MHGEFVDLLQQDWSCDCYGAVLAWIVAAEEPDWVVMHGSVLSDKVGKRIGHAWCERGGFVADLAMPIGSKLVERERYYRVLQPEVSRTYTSDDALLLSIRNGHNGPWEESEQLAE